MWTDRQIKAIKPRKRRYRLAEATKQRGTGRLVLDIQPNGVKTFFFKYSRNLEGKAKRIHIKIGRYKDSGGGYTLYEARKIAGQYGDMIKKGIDPKYHLEEQSLLEADKRRKIESAKKQATFGQLLESYVTNMEVDGKRSFKSVERSLETYVRRPFPKMIDNRANEIEAGDIKSIIGRMIKNNITTHANRVRSYLHAAFQHGLNQDNNPRHYTDSPILFNLKYNPVSFVPKQADYERVGEHVVVEKNITTLWKELEPEIACVLVKLAFCTGQRTGELIRVPVADISLKEKVLLINKDISKNKLDHIVPLSSIAISTLKLWLKEIDGCKYLFPAMKSNQKFVADKHTSSTTIAKHLRDYIAGQKKVEKFIPRDIRRTVKTLMGKAGIDKAIRDRIQNHSLQDVSSKHYDRYDYLPEKRQALKVWNDYLDLIINPRKKVTHISKKRA